MFVRTLPILAIDFTSAWKSLGKVCLIGIPCTGPAPFVLGKSPGEPGPEAAPETGSRYVKPCRAEVLGH